MAFVLALLAAALYGAGDFAGGRAARRAPLYAVTAASQAVGLILVSIAAPLSAPWAAQRTLDLAWGAAAGISGGLGVALLYRGLSTAAASLVAPVSGVVGVVLPVLVGLFSGERPGAAALSGIGLAALAVALVGSGPDGQGAATGGSRRALTIAVLSGVFIGGFLVCLGRTGTDAGFWPLVAARVVSVALFTAAVLAAAPEGGEGERPTVRTARWTAQWTARWTALRPAAGAVLVCGVLDVTANALYQLAVRAGELATVATVTNLYPASTVVLSIVLLRERPRGLQVAGFALAAVAVVLITR